MSDSAIDMGGSDSGGSIQQPLMDREVISIGGSSSEDTRRGAFDSDSSSLKRLRALCCIGGGTSRLHGMT